MARRNRTEGANRRKDDHYKLSWRALWSSLAWPGEAKKPTTRPAEPTKEGRGGEGLSGESELQLEEATHKPLGEPASHPRSGAARSAGLSA